PDPVARLTAGAFQMVDGGPDASVLVEHVPYPFPLLIGERTEVDCLVELTQTLDAEDPGGAVTAAPPVTVAAFAAGVGHPGVDDQQSQSLLVESDENSHFESMRGRQPGSDGHGRFDVEVDAADHRARRLGDLIDDSCRMAEPPPHLPGHELGGRELAGQPLAGVVAVIGDDP